MANLSQHAGGGLPSSVLPDNLNPDVRALLDSLIVYWPGNYDIDNKAWFRNRGWVAPDNVTGTLTHTNYMGGTTTFNGTNYIYWENIDELGWDGSQPFSAVCDLYQSTSANEPLFGIGANTGHNQNGWLVMRNLNTDLYFQVNAAVGYPNDQLQCYGAGGTASTWHTWAVSYDGSKDDSGATFYRDGASQATVTGANTLTGDASPATNRFYIGSDSGGSNLNAQIGSIFIFDRELTTNEMSWMTNGILRPYVEYLRADTKFNLGIDYLRYAPELVIADSFDDTDSTAITAHTPELGSSWTNAHTASGTASLSASDQILGNELSLSVTNIGIGQSAGSNNVLVTATWTPSSSTDNRSGLTARWSADGVCYEFNVRRDNGDWQLIDFNDPAINVLTSGAYTWNADQRYRIAFLLQGSRLRGYIDAVEIFDVTDTVHETADTVGIVRNGGNTTMRWDNFKAYRVHADTTYDQIVGYL
jgi:hypothetical protein